MFRSFHILNYNQSSSEQVTIIIRDLIAFTHPDAQ
jgi:hypothetical protein